jgi:hypothetical protein
MSVYRYMSYVSCIEAGLIREAIFYFCFYFENAESTYSDATINRAEQIKYTRKWNEKCVFTSDYAHLTGAGLFVVY